MKKQIVGIILGIAIINLASAMYAGECLPVDLNNMTSLDNVIYDVVGNSSNLEGLTIELNGTIANICTVPNYKPDSFTIIFIDNSTKEVITEVPVYRGGGTRTITKVVNNTIEVPNYIDREVIKEIEKEVEGEKITIKEMPIWLNILYVLLIVIFSIALLKSIRRNKELKEFGENETQSKTDK